jgi:MFS family permease
MALSGGRLTGSLYILNSGWAEYVVGVFMALFSIIPVMTALSIGRWVDRTGAARVMRFGISLVLIGAWLPVLHLSVPTLLITAMFIGFGFNVLSVAAQHTVGYLVSDASPSQRLANFAWYAMGHSVSSTLGPFMAGVAIDVAGHRVAFALLALCTCVAAYLVFTKAKKLPAECVDSRANTDATDAAADEAEPSEIVQKPHVLDLLATPEMKRIYWVNMVMSASWDLFIVMLPVLGHRSGFSASVIGTVFSLFAFGTFVSRAAMPWLSRRANEWQIIRVSAVVISLVFVVMPFATLAPVLMLAGFVFGMAVGMSQPNMLSLVHAAAPAGRSGEAVGFRSVIGNGCSVTVPLAFGAAVAPLGITPLLVGGAAFFASAIPVAHAGVRNRQLPNRAR